MLLRTFQLAPAGRNLFDGIINTSKKYFGILISTFGFYFFLNVFIRPRAGAIFCVDTPKCLIGIIFAEKVLSLLCYFLQEKEKNCFLTYYYLFRDFCAQLVYKNGFATKQPKGTESSFLVNGYTISVSFETHQKGKK